MARLLPVLGCAALACWLALPGCDDEAAGGAGPDGPDMEFDARVDLGADFGRCRPGSIREGRGCAALPPDPCPILDDHLGEGCVDVDGDCFPESCPGLLRPELIDCDDRRPESRPGADERCNGRDDDCDGEVDEGFEIGAFCQGCTGAGKTECAVGDDNATACSTDYEQPDTGDAPIGRCGEDADCDGVADPTCRLSAPPAERTAVALCGAAVLWVEAGRLIRLHDGVETELSAGPVMWPACADDTAAWVEAAGGCVDEPIAHCLEARVFAKTGDAAARDLAGLGAHGPPVVGEGRVLWHRLEDDRPILMGLTVPDGRAEALSAARLSDPSPPVGGLTATRAWDTSPPRIFVHALEGTAPVVRGVGSVHGRPSISDDWAAWRAGEPSAVRAVALGNARASFQVTAGHASAVWLDADRAVWLEGEQLRMLDLALGTSQTIIDGVEAADVRAGRATVIRGDAVVQITLP